MNTSNQDKAAKYNMLRNRLIEAAADEAWSGAQPPGEAQAIAAELMAARLELDQFVVGLITGLEV